MGSGISSSRNEKLTKQNFIYTLCLGHGGFSKVYSAMNTSSGKWYAIKEISLKNILQQKIGSALEMIRNEFEIMKRLHQNFYSSSSSSSSSSSPFSQLHYAFTDTSACYLVFDLLTGGDLRYHLRKQNHFSENGIAFLIASISSALHHLHSHGILHRDIKPENILLDSYGTPTLIDYGVSYLTPHPPSSRIVCTESSGTRQYLAPEVLTRSHAHGVESDFWSLGVVMFELLYHRRPFEKYCPVEFVEYAEIARLRGDRHAPPMTAAHKHTNYNNHTSMTLETNPFSSSALLSTHPLLSPTVGTQTPTGVVGAGVCEGEEVGEQREQREESESVRYQKQREQFIADCLRQYCLEVEQNPFDSTLTDPMSPASPPSRPSARLTRVPFSTPSGSSLSPSPSPSTGKRCTCGDQLYDEIFCQSPHHHSSSPFKKNPSSSSSPLPHHLTVPLPHLSKIYGTLSSPCLEVMNGFLDVRLWSRLGAGANYSLLASHSWFRNHEVDWVFRSPLFSSSHSPAQRDPNRYFIPCQQEINYDLYQRFVQDTSEGYAPPLGQGDDGAGRGEGKSRWTMEQQRYLEENLGDFYFNIDTVRERERATAASNSTDGGAGDKSSFFHPHSLMKKRGGEEFLHGASAVMI
jgi:serine/threonine protein kinase